jgi:hypothetical protein
MYIQLFRNQPNGSAITGRLVINGRWFCNTLERVGYQIPPLCYHLAVTMSPKFKRLLPIVQNVPQTPPNLPFRGEEIHTKDELPPLKEGQGRVRTGIRIHRGSKPEHSTGCVLVVADNMTPPNLPYRGEEIIPSLEGRSGGSVENQLTQLLLKAQKEHEEIILEVTDFRAGTELGYNTPCPSSECAREKEIRSANFARRHSSSILEPTRLSDGC